MIMMAMVMVMTMDDDDGNDDDGDDETAAASYILQDVFFLCGTVQATEEKNIHVVTMYQ